MMKCGEEIICMINRFVFIALVYTIHWFLKQQQKIIIFIVEEKTKNKFKKVKKLL